MVINATDPPNQGRVMALTPELCPGPHAGDLRPSVLTRKWGLHVGGWQAAVGKGAGRVGVRGPRGRWGAGWWCPCWVGAGSRCPGALFRAAPCILLWLCVGGQEQLSAKPSADVPLAEESSLAPIQAFFEGSQHPDWLMCGVERLGRL